MDKFLYTYGEIGRRLGVRYETVSDIVKKKRIPWIVHPTNGRAKAIDSDGLKIIEDALAATETATVAV